jgi:N-sulfoglucosamine sulfohydrolase
MRIRIVILMVAATCGGLADNRPAESAEKPNILWITSEDNSPYLGCYGDKQALTPNLDKFSEQGIRFRNAFANAPVCSTARSTLITGMYACSLGVHHHRSRQAIPKDFRGYPHYLQQAGYYCTNNAKQDYNITGNIGKVWDESSRKAHYKNRKDGQPFFAVFNLHPSHEGQLLDRAVLPRRRRGLLPQKTRIAPEDFKLPPYHPDTPIIRKDWARYYDNMTLMDSEAGDLLKELDELGLSDDTIVFYYADHGGALPRGKRNIHDSGTRVPFILRIPDKWKAWAPAKPGEWIDQPVSFIDLPPTILSLANAEAPKQFQGRAFLGPHKKKPRDSVFLFRGRMDERYDTVRAIRTQKYRYVRNFSPHRPWGQHYFYPFEVQPSMGSWYDAFKAGKCNVEQKRYWQPKPPEEFYDIEADPHETHNLIGTPGFADKIDEMRRILFADILEIHDLGFIPESMYAELARDRTLYDFSRSDEYSLNRILSVANIATSRDPAYLERLISLCQNSDPIIRYWAATGLLVLGNRAKSGIPALQELGKDKYVAVRVAAAEALGKLGKVDEANAILKPVLTSKVEMEVLAAITAYDFIQDSKAMTVDEVKAALGKTKFTQLPLRISGYLRGLK